MSFSEWQKREAENKASAISQIKDIAARAKSDGITGSLLVMYDGCGDSGDLHYEDIPEGFEDWCKANDISFDGYPKLGSWNPETRQYDKVEGEPSVFLMRLFDHIPPGGWEINEGSFGEITLDFETGKIHHEHNERVEEVNWSEDSY